MNREAAWRIATGVAATAVLCAGWVATRPVWWVRTLSGGGQAGYADGPVDSARWYVPTGLALDASTPGRPTLYVADTYNHRIQRFDADGNYLGQWGSTGSGNSQFSYPNGVGVDGTGNVTVADTSNNRIQNFDSNGNYLNQWGASGSGDGQFNSPIGVAVDGASNVYVADSNNNRIQKFNQTGVVLDDDESHNFEDLASGTYFITEQVPAGWWLDGIDCDGGSPVVDGNRVSLALAGGDDVTCTFTNNQPATLTITKATNPTGGTGFPFTIEPGTNRYVTQWGGFGSGNGLFISPTGVAADGAGNVYVADTYNDLIQKFDSDGNYLDQWGGTGSGDGQFQYPQGVAADGAGNVYVADQSNHRIQKFDGGGNYLDQWGSYGSGDGQFYYPLAVVVDGAGNVYVADTYNNRIQKFDGDGNYLDQWGGYGSGDGQFSNPTGVAADGAGNIYVVDQSNSRIQKFGPAGATLDDGQSHTFSDLAAGIYVLTEDVPGGWYLVDIDCGGATATRDGDSVSVTVEGGDDVECVFTNSDTPPPTTGSIRVTKEIIGSGTGTFTICVESDCKAFSGGDGEQQTWADLAPGDYTVSEQDAGPDWDEPPSQEVTVVAGQTADATVTNTYDSPAGVFMSAIAAGTTSDGLAYGSEDILLWDGTAWSTWFDGSAAGLEPKKAKHDIDAIWIPDPDGEEFIFSFTQNRRTIPGVGPNVDGMDLVRWDGSAFSFWFDGSDVFLTNKTQEKIDALHILPGGESPIGSGCLAYLLVSTQGPGKVPNFNGGQLKFQGEDVLGFCATSLGQTTAGLWHMVLDGSAAGMPRNSTDSISVSDDGQTMYLTTQGAFNVDAAAGGHSMVYAYDFATGTFSGPLFSAPAAGLPNQVTGLHVDGPLP